MQSVFAIKLLTLLKEKKLTQKELSTMLDIQEAVISRCIVVNFVVD